MLPASELLSTAGQPDSEQRRLALLILAAAARLGPLAENWHTFRTGGPPEIANLLSATERLMATPLTPVQRELANIIQYCSARLNGIIRRHAELREPAGSHPPPPCGA